MKKKIILIMIIFNISILFAEHIDIPISVLLESRKNDFNVDEFNYQEEKQEREMKEKTAEIDYLRDKLKTYEEDEKPNKKWSIFKSKKNRKSRKMKKKREKKGLDLHTKFDILLPSSTGIADVNTNLGFKGELEIIKPTNILGGLEFGGGIAANINAFDLSTTENGIETSGSAISANPDIYTTTSYNFISVPVYGVMKYNINSDNLILKDLYFISQVGYSLNIGNVPSATGGLYYGVGLGKELKGFTLGLTYSGMSSDLDFSGDFAPDDATEEELEKHKFTIDLNRISLNFGYKFNLRKFF